MMRTRTTKKNASFRLFRPSARSRLTQVKKTPHARRQHSLLLLVLHEKPAVDLDSLCWGKPTDPCL